MRQTRNPIEDVWGQRTPYEGENQWPIRVDEYVKEEPERWVQSSCVLCSNGCGMDIGVKEGKIVGVRGREVDRTNRGRLGPKGMCGWQANASKDRLTRPLLRENGALREASWDEAMNLIVSRCRETIAKYSSNAIGFYNSGQLFLEEYYTLSMLAYGGISTNHVDSNTRLCTATASQAMRETFGSDGQTCSYTDIDETDCLFLIGSNMAETQTVLWARILDRLAGPRRPRLIVVDPRRTPTAAAADIHLAPRPATNVALLNGLLHLLIAHGYEDKDFLDKHTQGFERLQQVVREYPPARVRQITGIDESTLEQTAEILGTSKGLLSCVLQGVYQSNQATAAACQVNNINLILGRIARPGCGIMQMNGQPTSQNTRETGCDGEYPFFLNFQNPEHIRRWASLWNVDDLTLPHWHTHAHAMEIFHHAENGLLPFLWIIGTNPAVSMPELHRIRKNLGQSRLFVIVQDAFLTETTPFADVVLPAAIWGEKTGTFTNIDRTVHISHKAIEPPGEARSDLDILLDFAHRMDFRDKDGQPLLKWSNPEGAFDHWAKCSKGWLVDYSGMSYEMLSRGSGIQWPCNDRFPDGCSRIYTDFNFHTAADITETFGHDLETGGARTPGEYRANDPQGRALLKAANYLPPLEEPDDEYPFFLTTGRIVYHFHTRTKTGRAAELQQAAPDGFVQISVQDAERLGVKEGDELEVSSRRGRVRGAAKIGNIAPGTVFIPFHYGYWDKEEDHHRAANELTISGWDPVSKQPSFKYAAVQVQKVGALLGDMGNRVRDTMSKALVLAKEMTDELLSGTHPAPRSHVPDVLGQLRAELGQFAKECRSLKKIHLEEMELISVWETMALWCDHLQKIFAPFLEKYGELPDSEPEALRQTLFPAIRTGDFGVLRDLQSLEIFAAALQGTITVLFQTAQGLHDREMLDTTLLAEEQIKRAQAWLLSQIKHRTVASLVIPS